jgi:hypothetical protein
MSTNSWETAFKHILQQYTQEFSQANAKQRVKLLDQIANQIRMSYKTDKLQLSLPKNLRLVGCFQMSIY